MLRWSQRRQAAYLGGFLLLLAAIGLWWWQGYRPAANCFDGRQNGDETGVDCGGSCVLACRDQAADLKIIWSRVLPVAPGLYAVAAQIENPNPRFGIRRLTYSFRLVDDNNILVTYREGQTFVNPGETFLIVEGGITTGAGRPARAFLELGRSTWETPGREAPILIVTAKTFTNGTPSRLAAEIFNNSIVDLKQIEVKALLTDRLGNALAAGSTFLEDLPRDATKTAYFAWPQAVEPAPALIDIYARANVFSL